ncbi:hypothetical protein NPIL_402911 [Nephila pilipes]|uniref:Uncharacterized protein n=1 Tax=Nephila pilipes TaxID=299642 RepID=A0A8X6TIM9_NEPPI|nr:hypothetical protein NPIL_402911 [Nephila pilipes]
MWTKPVTQAYGFDPPGTKSRSKFLSDPQQKGIQTKINFWLICLEQRSNPALIALLYESGASRTPPRKSKVKYCHLSSGNSAEREANDPDVFSRSCEIGRKDNLSTLVLIRVYISLICGDGLF